MSGQLLTVERDRLAELEQTIERGLQTFVEVGAALAEIRDSWLYRATHRTFEDYCRDRWGFVASRARQLIAAAETVTAVTVDGLPAPANEAQARELVPLLREDEREAVETWRELRAEHGERITADKVRAAVSERVRRERLIGTVMASTGNEWYTPATYVDAARDVLGGEIDLDPASSAQANATVRARVIYDEQANGLEQQWHGRVWLNPPYGSSTARFVGKLLEERAAGRVTAAVLLLNGYGFDAAWFQPLWSGALCFTDHRIRFRNPTREGDGGPTFGSVFVYLGPDRQCFRRVFGQFGAVVALVPGEEAA